MQEYIDALPPMASNARKFVKEQLTPEALSCYWLKVGSSKWGVYNDLLGMHCGMTLAFTRNELWHDLVHSHAILIPFVDKTVSVRVNAMPQYST